eukprot:TRINITY_DN733_c0_g2_i2.p2 TRINITY_DN733_c0_g2~~TRINITY_DN733_c0_g2_i2.p2  ORF type:complete len:265 (+),score=93.04 TRINITY_DN733_c0_g2_i2:125-919(+)
MAERKVLNKYYPPDFDPSKLIRLNKQPKDRPSGGYVVRMMLPMSVQCNTCGEYLYIGTKFNMRKENLTEYYLGIQIFRFYFKCTRCSSEITMKTDPKNSDYICERGATRNYEPWRDIESAVVAYKKKRLQEEEGDAMKSLENRTFDSKREMDILDALNEIKLENRRYANPDLDKVIEMVSRNKDLQLDQTDEEKLAKFRKRKTIEPQEDKSEENTGKEETKKEEKEFEEPVPKPKEKPEPTQESKTANAPLGFKLPFKLKAKKK